MTEGPWANLNNNWRLYPKMGAVAGRSPHSCPFRWLLHVANEHEKEIGISDTACTMHYRVKFNDGMKPFHYFRFDQAGYAFYVLVTRDFTKSHMWRNSTKEEFEQVPKKCHNGDDSQVSLVPLCNRKPTDSKIIQN
ncbi:hypothetical protein GCK32_014693 [Trichostrongylus colubriformis]|uniref:Uncharacterized protein n=1 Tax=Trichostrongylus colubriformis TaxID=6319 RepID=A0AAN8EWT5_TRICO